MKHWAVRISIVSALVVGLLAFYAYSLKVDQLNEADRKINFILGKKSDAQCAAAKTSRDLWEKMSAVVIARIPPDDPAGPQAQNLVKAVDAYAATNPSCDLKAPK